MRSHGQYNVYYVEQCGVMVSTVYVEQCGVMVSTMYVEQCGVTVSTMYVEQCGVKVSTMYVEQCGVMVNTMTLSDGWNCLIMVARTGLMFGTMFDYGDGWHNVGIQLAQHWVMVGATQTCDWHNVGLGLAKRWLVVCAPLAHH